MDRESALRDAAGSWLGAFDDEVRMTRPRRRALVAIGLGEFVDAYDLIVISGALLVLKSHFGLEYRGGGLVDRGGVLRVRGGCVCSSATWRIELVAGGCSC